MMVAPSGSLGGDSSGGGVEYRDDQSGASRCGARARGLGIARARAAESARL